MKAIEERISVLSEPTKTLGHDIQRAMRDQFLLFR
jgi:hypothetical protein